MLAHIRTPRHLLIFLQLPIVAAATAFQAGNKSLVFRRPPFLEEEEDQDDGEDKDDGAGDEDDDCDRAGVLVEALVAR